jgi:hypothetical protein
MTDTLTRKYQRTEFKEGAVKDCYDAVAEILDGEGWKFNITADYSQADGMTTRKRLSAADLSVITNMSGSPKSLSFEGFRDVNSQTLVLLQGWSDCLYLVTSAKDAAECLALNEVFVNGLGLQDIGGDYSKPAAREASSPRAQVHAATTLPLKSICQQMPISGWIGLCGLVIVAFVLGAIVG